MREAAGIRYRRVTASERPSLLVLLCHGYGAPGHDLVPLGEELIRSSEVIARGVVFLFPEAPLSLGGFPGFEQRAWWQIDIAALEAAMSRGVAVDRSLECPRELEQLRPRLLELLEEEGRNGQHSGEDDMECTIPMSRTVLGGFSQGAMLATDLGLAAPEAPAALSLFSGTLLCEEAWRRAALQRRELRILQSHGRQDPLLPFAAAVALRDLFAEAGLDHRFVPFDGQHEIPMPVLLAFRELLVELLT